MRRSFHFLATKINIIFGWYCLSCFERMSHKRHSIHRPTEMTRNGDLKCPMICEQMPRAPSTTNEKMLPWWWRWDETWLAKHNCSEWWSAMHHPNEPPATPCPVKMDWQPTSVMQWPTESESLSGTDGQPAHDCPLAEDWRPTPGLKPSGRKWVLVWWWTGGYYNVSRCFPQAMFSSVGWLGLCSVILGTRMTATSGILSFSFVV